MKKPHFGAAFLRLVQGVMQEASALTNERVLVLTYAGWLDQAKLVSEQDQDKQRD